MSDTGLATTGGERVVHYIGPDTLAFSAEAITQEHANLLKNAILAGDARLLSAAWQAALAGTNGTPGSGNKFVTDSDPRLAVGSGIIRGRINADGTKAAGTGFTSSKTATGTYAISFSSAFTAIPAIVLTAIPTSYSTVVALLKSPATTGFTVETRHTPDAGQADDPFHFIAMSV